MARVQLTERDLRQLRRASRPPGLLTLDSLQRTEQLASRAAARSVLRRLLGYPPNYRFLRRWEFHEGMGYYRLTPLGCRTIGVDKRHARELGPQARVESYALLWFSCLAGAAERPLFSPREFPEQFELKGHRLPRANFYLEGDVLGYLLVDHEAGVRRLVHKARTKLLRFLHHGWFDPWIADGSFRLTVLTTAEGKRRSLRRKLTPAVAELAAGVRLDILVVPGLAGVIHGGRRP